jgi:hypothetical protein
VERRDVRRKLETADVLVVGEAGLDGDENNRAEGIVKLTRIVRDDPSMSGSYYSSAGTPTRC